MSEASAPGRRTRRWVSLAEIVALAGLLIAAGTFYMNWTDREADRSNKARDTASEAKVRAIATLTGDVRDGGRTILLADPKLSPSAATLRFPAALRLPPTDAMPGPQIRADMFEAALLKATDKGADRRQGRLPMLITVSWWDGAERREDSGLYEVLWQTEGRLLQGRKLALTGIVLRERTGSAEALERAWQRQKPSA